MRYIVTWSYFLNVDYPYMGGQFSVMVPENSVFLPANTTPIMRALELGGIDAFRQVDAVQAMYTQSYIDIELHPDDDSMDVIATARVDYLGNFLSTSIKS